MWSAKAAHLISSPCTPSDAYVLADGLFSGGQGAALQVVWSSALNSTNCDAPCNLTLIRKA